MNRTIPARYLKTNSVYKTVATRSKKDGRFTGRRNIGGQGDRTSVRYLKKDTDLNHDGKIEPEERGGTIHGRNERVPVKASKRARGYVREI